MKSKFLIIKSLLVVAFVSLMVSCGGDIEVENNTPKNNFKYNVSELYGIWIADQIFDKELGEWCEIKDSGYKMLGFSIRFNNNYTYMLTSETTNENGKYTTNGTIVATFDGSRLVSEYDIRSLDDEVMEVTIIKGTSAVKYKLEKDW